MPYRYTLWAALVGAVLFWPDIGESASKRCAIGPMDFEGHRVTDLVRWYSGSRKDQFTTTDPAWLGCQGDRVTAHGGYQLERFEGGAFAPDAPQPPGTVPLHTWYSPSRQEHFTTTDPRWRGRPGAPMHSGYRYVRLEGYIYDPDRARPPGTLPLYSWWNSRRQDNFATSASSWNDRRRTTRRGYRRFRLEGFVVAPDRTPSAEPDAHLPGCFIDARQRDLPVQIPGERHTPSACRAACTAQGHDYAGIQFGGFCFCGDRFGRYGSAPATDCEMACRSDERYTCGGRWRSLIERADVPERPVVSVTHPRPVPMRSWSGVDLPGSDLQRIVLPAGSGPPECSAACEIERRCQAFSYVRPGIEGETPVCYLKHEVPTQRASDCCVSGVKITQDGQSRRAIPHQDSITPDGSAPTTPSACARACIEEPQCVSYSFHLRTQRCRLGSRRVEATRGLDYISGTVPSTCRPTRMSDDPVWMGFEHDREARRTTAVRISAPIPENFGLAGAEMHLPWGGQAPMDCSYSGADRSQQLLQCSASDGIDFCRLWTAAYPHRDPQLPRVVFNSEFDGGQCDALSLQTRVNLSLESPNCSGRCPSGAFGIRPSPGASPYADGAPIWTIHSDGRGGWRLEPSTVRFMEPAYVISMTLNARGDVLRGSFQSPCTPRRSHHDRQAINCTEARIDACDLVEHTQQGGSLQFLVRYARPAGCPNFKTYPVGLDTSLVNACQSSAASPRPDSPASGGSGNGGGLAANRERTICRDEFERDGPPEGYAPHCATSSAGCPARGDFDRSHNAVRVIRYTHKRSGERVKVDRNWPMPSGWIFVRYLDEPATCSGHTTPQSEWRRQ